MMAKKIIKEIFPRFGMLKEIMFDNRPAFVAQVSQGMAKTLGDQLKIKLCLPTLELRSDR